MEVKGVAVVSWNLVPSPRATTATRLGSPYPCHLHRPSRALTVGLFIVVRVIALRKAQHGPRRPDHVAPPCARVKVLALAAVVVSCRSREARDPRM